MVYLVPWDVKHNTPVVDGKVTNPNTGLVEAAGSEGYRAGPPMVDVIWHNMDSSSDFADLRASFAASVDEVYLEISKHIKEGLYSIVSISASAYAFHIICKSTKTRAQFHEAWVKMVDNLTKDLPSLNLGPPVAVVE